MEDITEYPCPACGFNVFDEPPGSYVICPICDWEDDHVQLKYPAMRGGANKESLFEHQQIWIMRIPLNVQEYEGYTRWIDWRPLRPEECRITEGFPETGEQYFNAAVEESPPYYWQKQKSKTKDEQ